MHSQAVLDKMWSCPSSLSGLQSPLKEVQQAVRTMQNLFSEDKFASGWHQDPSLFFLTAWEDLGNYNFLEFIVSVAWEPKREEGTSTSLEISLAISTNR